MSTVQRVAVGQTKGRILHTSQGQRRSRSGSLPDITPVHPPAAQSQTVEAAGEIETSEPQATQFGQNGQFGHQFGQFGHQFGHPQLSGHSDEAAMQRLRRENEDLKNAVRGKLRGDNRFTGGAQFRSGGNGTPKACGQCAKMKKSLQSQIEASQLAFEELKANYRDLESRFRLEVILILPLKMDPSPSPNPNPNPQPDPTLNCTPVPI